MAEKRVDPDDGAAYTYEELCTYYKGEFRRKEIEAYWEDSCTPMKARGNRAKARAKATGDAKAAPRAEAKASAKARRAERRPPRAAVVVDPYSSGKYLLHELKRRRIRIICVRSSTRLSPQFLKSHDANKKYCVEMLEFEDVEGLPQLVEQLQALPYHIVGVFGGSEPGVELADRLADALGMPAANGVELLQARKDKAEMQEALRRNGVAAAEQYKSGDLDELLEWAKARDQWPLVAKPVGGAGSDGVFICKSLDDIRAAHRGIIGNVNPTGVVNAYIALQEFLAGDEYIVDTVSYGGKHICVAIWVYTKRRGLPWNPAAIMSEQNKLLPASGETQDLLVSYVCSVLDAVGLRYGPCHTEVMLTPRGPVLVEVNARLHGLQGPRLIELATGICKAAYAADAVVGGGDLFRKLYQEGRAGRYLYPLLKECVQLVLISSVEGYLKTSITQVIADMKLPSVIETLPAASEGQFINKSCDLPTAAGSVLMVHESMEQIIADTKKIRDAEENGTLYIVSEQPLEMSKSVAPARKLSADSDLEGSLPRSRLDSMEKVDILWASMNEQPPVA